MNDVRSDIRLVIEKWEAFDAERRRQERYGHNDQATRAEQREWLDKPRRALVEAIATLLSRYGG